MLFSFIIFVVMDSQCDAFSQVSIIGDAFKVYLMRCFVIICHSSASEWFFNLPGMKLFSLLQGLLANAMSMFLAYCKAYCSRASQIFFGAGRYRCQYKTIGLLSDAMQPYIYIPYSGKLWRRKTLANLANQCGIRQSFTLQIFNCRHVHEIRKSCTKSCYLTANITSSSNKQ